MTTKAFSQSKMGRNPFSAKTVVTKPSASRAKTQEINSKSLFTALVLPYKGIILGIKSWLVARYVLTHPKEWSI